jgi:hypothetical protein
MIITIFFILGFTASVWYVNDIGTYSEYWMTAMAAHPFSTDTIHGVSII